MPCAGFSSELYDLYALGVLESADAAQIDEHLVRSCDTCQHEVQRSLEQAATFALAVPSVAPPRGLRNRIVGSVRPARTGVRGWFRSPALGWSMAAGCLLIAIGTYFSASRTLAVPQPTIISHVSPPPIAVPAPVTQLAETAKRTPDKLAHDDRSAMDALNRDMAQAHDRIQQLEAEVRSKDSQLASVARDQSALRDRLSASSQSDAQTLELRQQLASNRRQLDELTHQVEFYRTALQSQRAGMDREVKLISLLSAPSLRVLDLKATEQGGNASGRALLTGNNPLFFYAAHLPQLPAGRTYQLWVMRNRGRAVSSGGIFQPDAQRSATLTVPNAAPITDITALAITEEPSGGVPLPTGHKILIGTLKS